MGRHVAGECPELEKLVEEAIAGVGSEIAALSVPRLWGVVLGGGYARGEGGAIAAGNGGWRLSNDLDFFAISEEGAGEDALPGIASALEPVAAKWNRRLGIEVDFTVKTPWRIRHDQERLMIQELVHGYCDVFGAKGEEMFAGVVRREPGELPWMEAARLLMNRGIGLLLAKERDPADGDFVNRNINKCVLGAGDASMIARGEYAWKASERAERFGSELYARAVEWKFRPGDGPVCDWETARQEWLDGKTEVIAAVDDSGYQRSIRSAARWLLRRRTLGEFATFGMDPVVRVLERVSRLVVKSDGVGENGEIRRD